MRNLVVACSLLALVGCGEEETADNIKKKLESGEALTKKQQCIADTVVSSIIDPKNVMLYAATFDVLSRAYISQRAKIINYCRPMIQGSRHNDAFEDFSEVCPAELKNLSNDQLTELDVRAQQLASMAKDLDGSPLDVALGRCADL